MSRGHGREDLVASGQNKAVKGEWGKKGRPGNRVTAGINGQGSMQNTWVPNRRSIDGHVDSGLVRLSELAQCCESIKLQP